MRVLRFASYVSLALLAVAARSHDARANAWPPPEGADLTDPANWPSDPGYKGEWGYFSWLPVQAAGAPYLEADQALGASGMSVDRAWTIGAGRPDVILAIADTGIAWDEPDLLKQAWLNAKELAGASRPEDASGKVCGGAGSLAGYDCDGDGVFTIADYVHDPRITPIVKGDPCFVGGDRGAKGADRLAGDVNHNCVIDPGDLVALFSDRVDDDANGYTDDIAGWDFFKNDNDPYDDVRGGLGTAQALRANAGGNDALGSIGACPRCRFVPLRVADARLGDANDFAKAVVYAADNGASVVASGIETLDMTPFARAAIDYAYGLGVTVVTSAGEENAAHHAMPASALHTIPVHAIGFDGATSSSSTSFLGFESCGNFGGELALSAGAGGCSGDAAAVTAGIAGLLYATARAQAPPLKLSAEEVRQLLVSSADDIDVAESRDRSLAGGFYESRPGWDQRTGYGRVNAYRALAAIRQRLVPPEVDIASPGWFQPIFADGAGHAQDAVPIMARVAASRATTYDVFVEWAPGVEPGDAQFQPLAGALANVPASTVIGSNGTPVAMLDPRSIDTTHVADPDSAMGQNARTITIRVRAVAHYAATGDARGEARRTVTIVNQTNGLDADLAAGFPLRLGGSIEGGAKLVDLDGDRVRDVVVATSDGLVHALTLARGAPAELPGFPAATRPIDGLNVGLASDPEVPSYVAAPAYGASGGVDPTNAREAILGTPAVADLDGDGAIEIVVSTWPGTIYVFERDGTTRAGWPKRLPLVPSCPLDPSKARPSGGCMDVASHVARGAYASPVLVDLDRDGKLDVVQAAFDGRVYALRADGVAVAGWPVSVHDARAAATDRVMTTPAVVDLNGDGVPDLVVGSNETVGAGRGALFAIDGRGAGGGAIAGWPIERSAPALVPIVGQGIAASPVVADLNHDGAGEVIAQSNGDAPLVVRALDPTSRIPASGFGAEYGALSRATLSGPMSPLFGQPSIGDLDQDGTPDVVMSGGSSALASVFAEGSRTQTHPTPFEHLLAFWSGATGAMLAGAPVPLEGYTWLSSGAIADVTGDDYPEVVIGTGGGMVRAVDACGREAPGWPKLTSGWVLGSPAIGDVDGDHALEVVVGTRDGWLFAWHTKGTEGGVVAWESFHHDGANTGDYGRPLGQGVTRRASAPLACAPAPSVVVATYDAGGCDVGETLGRSRRATVGRGADLLALLAFAAFWRRRVAKSLASKGAGDHTARPSSPE